MRERGKITVFPWDKAITYEWFEKIERIKLKTFTIDELVPFILSLDIKSQVSAILELEIHGSRKKAAQLARALRDKNLSFQNALSKKIGERGCKYLLNYHIDLIPGKPSEFPKKYVVEYLQ